MATKDEARRELARRELERRNVGSSESAPESTGMDVLKSAGAGLAQGTAGLIGLPGTLNDLFDAGVTKATNSLAGALGYEGDFTKGPPSSKVSASSLSDYAGTITNGATDYQPQTTPGKYAEKVGEFLPGAALGGTAGSLLRYGVLPGLANEGAGQLTEGSSAEPYARLAASLVAPMVPSMAARAVSPFAGSISPERSALVDALRAEGVNPTAGQITGSRGLRFAESELGGATTRNIIDDQARAFTEAATARAGMAGIADPANMNANAQRLGQGFTNISARNAIQSDPQFGGDIGRVLNTYDRVLPSAQREIVNNMADDIIDVAANNSGVIPGDIYQATRSRLGSMAQGARNSDPQYSQALRGLRNSLDDAMGRSVSPDDAAEWAQLRHEYGNSKILEKAATGAGEGAAIGTISPAKLRQAAVSGRQGGYARGQGDLDGLARAGQGILTPLPDSGTASRLAVRGLMSTPAAAGAIVGGSTGDVISGLAGAAAGMAVPAVAGRALMSAPVQAYLTNQVAPNMTTIDPRSLALIQALLFNPDNEER